MRQGKAEKDFETQGQTEIQSPDSPDRGWGGKTETGEREGQAETQGLRQECGEGW